MVGVVPDTGAGDEVVKVDQLRLCFRVFDDLLPRQRRHRVEL